MATAAAVDTWKVFLLLFVASPAHVWFHSRLGVVGTVTVAAVRVRGDCVQCGQLGRCVAAVAGWGSTGPLGSMGTMAVAATSLDLPVWSMGLSLMASRAGWCLRELRAVAPMAG